MKENQFKHILKNYIRQRNDYYIAIYKKEY